MRVRLPVIVVMMSTVMGALAATGSACGTDINGLKDKSIVTVPEDMKGPPVEDT